MNSPFRMVLDGSTGSGPHLFERVPHQDPFTGEALCGEKSEAFTAMGRSVYARDSEVCEACMNEAVKRWEATTKA